MATPFGAVPTVTSETPLKIDAFAGLRISSMDAVPALLLLTTAIPSLEITSTPVGPAPTLIVLIRELYVELAGSMSMIDTVLHPVLVTTAMLRISSMATPEGCGFDVPLHVVLTSTDPRTVKSVTFDPTLLFTITSSAKRLATFAGGFVSE